MDSFDCDLRKTMRAMEVLASWIPRLYREVESDIADRFDNALLNIAVHRLVEEEGKAKTATILFRLAEAVAADDQRLSDNPVELTNLNG